jgi:hypothetical protein
MTAMLGGVEPVSGNGEDARMFHRTDINPQAEVHFSHVTR